MKKLFTGGADGKILIWNKELKNIQSFDIKQNFKSLNPKVRALNFEDYNNLLLVGTRGGEILTVDITETDKKNLILNSHFSKELWGLAVHPTE